MAGERPRVVILGGGFAGLYAARELRRAPVRVTVLDRRNHHLFQPLLYQVATAGLNASEIAMPIRSILRRQKNAEVLLGDATAIDVPNKKVILSDGEVPYDYLVVATGVTHSYFGHNEWAEHAPGLKTLEDALEVRRRVFLAFEAAERETDPARRREWLTFVIVGAGPTGVELAGTLAEISRHSLVKEFRHINPKDARIILVEGVARVLPPYPEELSKSAARQLSSLGVELRTNARVTGIDTHGVQLEQAAGSEPRPASTERIAARTTLWAAGVQASPLAKSLGVPLDRAGRVIVHEDLTIPGRDDVFVIGDLAAVKQTNGQPVPGVAPAAIQEGKHTAKNIQRAVAGEPRLPFRYRDKGSLATIGRARAVADFGKLKLSGFLAWLAWLLIHIFFLIGFRNRVLVTMQWAWSYFTYQRGARLITGAVEPLLSDKPEKPGD
jgi:NADH:ubiquinone reductase (H+-translocating)